MKSLCKLLLMLGMLGLSAWADPKCPIPDQSFQAVLVLSSSWDDPTALMQRFERASASDPWGKVGKPIPVNLGRTGLAWGESPLMEEPSPKSTTGPRKKEGDGKSPAGLFPLLKAFGHPKPPQGYGDKNLPFLLVEDQQCVDDGNSEYYNQIVEPNKVGGVTWDSAEKMKIDLYQLGLVVGHNCPDASPGLGSCIFFHLQSGPKKPTSGCTSMEEAALSQLLLWLKRDARPVVLQMPQARYKSLMNSTWPKI